MPESLIEQSALGNGGQFTRSYLEVYNAGTLTAFLKGEVTLSSESFKSLQGINTVK